MDTLAPTPRTQIRRLPKRAVYDREQIYSILDEGFLCHIGFVADGMPYVIPTSYVRVDDLLYIHGSAVSRIMRLDAGSLDVCVNVTLVDGFVMARSVFHHSMNYRSVVVMGKGRLVTDHAEKLSALRAFTNSIAADRWEEARQPSVQELKATGVLALPVEEASAKVRTGGPLDDEPDYELPVWAGVIPICTTVGQPIRDSRTLPGVEAMNLRRIRKNLTNVANDNSPT